MRYLTLDEVLVLHAYQIEKFGGNPNIRDVKLLESAIFRPQTTLSGKEMYESIYEKASVLAVGLIQNHPFIDGNKRTGMHAMLVFLELNGFDTNLTNAKIARIGKDIAKGNLGIKELTKILEKSSQHRS